MKLRVRSCVSIEKQLHTRIPFRYGIATMTHVTHLFLKVHVDIDGRTYTGVAADNLPPKWFTKDPDSPVEQDVEQMRSVIRSACSIAEAAGTASSVFALSKSIGDEQHRALADLPPLLANFGASLVERAIISAVTQAVGAPFHRFVHAPEFGVSLAACYPQLAGRTLREFLPAAPLDRVAVRHTVGLGDPLTDADVAPADRIDDGLPHSLEACTRAYDLKYLKIKLSGDVEGDLDRMLGIARVVAPDIRFTLDGNEQYRSVESLRAFWERFTADPRLTSFLKGLIFLEQPLHREIALRDDVRQQLIDWRGRPAMIIDESGGDLASVERALDGGYVGASHKNCKGVIKGLAAACLIKSRGGVQSGEDLSNVGPVALLQDLAVVATLGIGHVERNGHHYFRGLSVFPPQIAEVVAEQHADLLESRGDLKTLRIGKGGEIALSSVNAAPFGLAGQDRVLMMI